MALQYRPNWLNDGWLADDTGAWHHFSLHYDLMAHPDAPYWLVRTCDDMRGRQRAKAPRFRQRPAGKGCAACWAELDRIKTLPEAPEVKGTLPPPKP